MSDQPKTKLSKFFSPLRVGRVPREEVMNRIHQEARVSFQYVALLALSVIIATLGTIIDSSAIVIGAMILAPLLWPILGIALAITTNDGKLLRRAVFLTVVSIVIALGFAAAISLASPLKEITDEIAARTSPTILDLIIALVSGVAAIIVITWPKLSSVMAGIAVAASLVPPLAVSGIGVGFTDARTFWGGLLLFATNLFAIIFAGVIVFYFLGFYHKRSTANQETLRVGLLTISVFLLIIVIPLSILFARIIYEREVNTVVEEVLDENFEQLSSDITVLSIEVPTVKRTSRSIAIETVVQVPTEVKLTQQVQNTIASVLSQRLEKEVELQIRISPVLEISQSSVTQSNDQLNQVKKIVEEAVFGVSRNVLVDETTLELADEGCLNVETTLLVPNREDFSEGDVNEISSQLAQSVDTFCDLRVNTVQTFTN